MFKLESYVTPLLMGYVDAYVKLRPDDLQLSLWGGDVTLSKLELRLDALQRALPQPLSLRSGHIHELRLHVPWTRLGYEPVIVTINTIECVLTLDGHACHGDAAGAATAPTPPADTADIPPGYLQGLVNRIVNNVNIVVNNLILKFVDDDVVLSVNVKSAECYSVGDDWTRQFVDVAADASAMLRRVIDVHDLTVCLDRRDASGHIGAYQDPLLYRCSLECRLTRSVRPRLTRLSVLCGQLELSLTDVQAPMFARLIQLAVAVYYGTLPTPAATAAATDETAPSVEITMEEVPMEEDDQGWGSWMWSYVPQILPEEEGGAEGTDAEGSSRKSGPSLTAIGLYIKTAVILFKSTEIHRSSGAGGGGASGASGPHKVAFRPYAQWEADGLALEVLIQGLGFFDVQLGISASRLSCLGDDVGARHAHQTRSTPMQDACFFSAGDRDLLTSRPLHYLSGSLFDGAATTREFVTDEQAHLDLYTESYVLQRYGACFFDYLFTAEELEEEKDSAGELESLPDSEVTARIDRENSTMRLIVCPCDVVVSSAAVRRVQRLLFYASDHSYQACSVPFRDDAKGKSRALPSIAEMEAVEEYSPVRSYQLTLLQPRVRLVTADLPPFDPKLSKTSASRHHRKAKTRSSQSGPVVAPPLPTIVLNADSFGVHLLTAMYPRQVALVVSKMAAPSDDLLHRCHSHMNVKLYGFEGGLTLLEGSGQWAPVQRLVQPCSVACYKRDLLYPRYWSDALRTRSELTSELAGLRVATTAPQILLLGHCLLSWWLASPPSPSRLASLSLVRDVFDHAEGDVGLPLLELSISGVQLTRCTTGAVAGVTATVSSIQAKVVSNVRGSEEVTPLLYGPLDTGRLSDIAYFEESTRTPSPSQAGVPSDPCIALTVQVPCDPLCPLAPAVFFVEMKGIVGCLDPILYDWLSYAPTHSDSTLLERSIGVVDSVLSQTALPLKDHNSAESVSGNTVTTTQTGSHLEPLVTSTPDCRGQPPSRQASDLASGRESGGGNSGWGRALAAYFPLVKIMEVQVALASCCLFAPTSHVPLVAPTSDVAANLRAAHQAAGLPPTLVVCCPLVRVLSSGRTVAAASGATTELPVHALGHSVAGDKLPWSVRLEAASVYTVRQGAHYVLRPLSAAVTLAVTCKYSPPTSDDLSSLGLCVHTDMGSVSALISRDQLELLSSLGARLVELSSTLRRTLLTQHRLYRPSITSEPRLQAPPPIPHDVTVESSSGVVVVTAPTTLLMSETSESLSLSVADSVAATTVAGGVALSLWLQWTLPQCVATLYGEIPQSKELLRVRMTLDDLTTAIDVQQVYLKVKCNVGSASIVHHVRSDGGGQWTAGALGGVVLSSAERFRRDVRVVSPHSVLHQAAPPAAAAAVDDGDGGGGGGFVRATFTSALRRDYASRGGREPTNRDATCISELCLDFSPCDVALDCAVLATLAAVVPPSATRAQHQSATAVTTPLQLPLLHVTAKRWRLLVPAGPDVVVLSVGSVCLAPHADNPLPRVAVGVGGHRPVRATDDRQFQLDVTSLSVSTGCWRHLLVNAASDRLDGGLAVQNPAVEWNNVASDSASNESASFGDVAEPCLLPLVTTFDLRVVFAPAVVDVSHGRKPTVAFCSAVELNATTDVDFFVSAAQIRLVVDVASRLAGLAATSCRPADGVVAAASSADVPPDSGVESDASTLQASVDARDARQAAPPAVFDVLLTARRVSVVLYRRCAAAIDPTTSGVARTSDDAATVLPLVYVEFSQPHAALAGRPAARTVEMSCYDVVLKGVQPHYHFYERDKLLPDVVDFTRAWLETKPGRADRHTGIPPCLYTLGVSLPANGPATLKVRLERPLKVNLSLCKVDQLLDFAKVVLKDESANVDEETSESSPQPEETSDSYLSLPSDFEARLSTVQLVVATETKRLSPDAVTAAVQWSVSSTVIDVSGSREGGDDCVTFSVSLADHLVRTSLGDRWRTLVGPVRIAADVACRWACGPGGRPGARPRVLALCETGPIEVRVGHDQWLAGVSLYNHVSEYIQEKSAGRETEDERTGGGHDATPATPSEGGEYQCATHSSTDDLRTGQFEYVFDNSGADVLPAPNEIMFSRNENYGHAILTWQYTTPRIVTYIEVTPVPFTLPSSITEEIDIEVRCVLEQWNAVRSWFEFYAEFRLAPGRTCAAELAPGAAAFVPTQGWRVVILHPADDDRYAGLFDGQSSAGGATGVVEAVVSAETLAGSMKVNSRSAGDGVPAVQLSVTLASLHVRWLHHAKQFSTETPASLRPFTVAPPMVSEEEVLVLSLKKTTAVGSYRDGHKPRSEMEVQTCFAAKVLEYRHLTMRPLVDDTDIELKITQKDADRWLTEVSVQPTRLYVGQLALHTLSAALGSWQQVFAADRFAEPCTPSQYYLICNDTSEAIRVGQVDTDESVVIASRQLMPYSWRSTHQKQCLRLSLAAGGWTWCEPPVALDTGTTAHVIDAPRSAQRAALFVSVTRGDGLQRKIIVRGALLVTSRLGDDLEVQHVPPCPLPLPAAHSLPSWVLPHPTGQAAGTTIKVRLAGQSDGSPTWSHDIPVVGSKVKDSRLVKVPLAGRASFQHIWCEVITRLHGEHAENLVVFSPVFVVRSQLPTSLVMNVATTGVPGAQQVALAGRGQQLPLQVTGGDKTHHVTFQRTPERHSSVPALAISSSTVDQLDRLPLVKRDTDSLCYDWRSVERDRWPYNQADRQTDSITAQRTDLPPVDDQTNLNQDNVDLQISLSEQWPGLRTLVIDVAPSWLFVNDSDVDVTVTAGDEHQWSVAAHATTAPPIIQSTFRLGIVQSGRLHLSDPLEFSPEDSSARYLPRVEGRLYRNAHVPVTVAIQEGGRLKQVCYLTLHSRQKGALHVVTVRERFPLSNRTGMTLRIRCYALPLTQQDGTRRPLSAAVSHQVSLPDAGESSTHSLLFWCVPASSSPAAAATDCARYVSVSVEAGEWSDAVRLRLDDRLDDDGSRALVAVPLPGAARRTTPLTLSAAARAGTTHVALTVDRQPAVLLHNNCAFALHAAQQAPPGDKTGVATREEAELTLQLPTVAARSCRHYAFPDVDRAFPQIPAQPISCRLLFAAVASSSAVTSSVVWSYGVDVETEHDMFVTVPASCDGATAARDVKVHVDKVAQTTHVFVDSVTRAEVSAREIRSRIRGRETVVVETTPPPPPPSPPPPPPAKRTAVVETSTVVSLEKEVEEEVEEERIKFDWSFRCEQVVVSLIDEWTNADVVTGIVDVTADAISCHGLTDASSSRQRVAATRRRVTVAVADVQLDNQLYGRGNYDFAVVLPGRAADAPPEPDMLTMELTRTSSGPQSSWDELDVRLRPLVVCIDDVFVHDFLAVLASWGSAAPCVIPDEPPLSDEPPTPAMLLSLAAPLRLSRVSLSLPAVVASIHASLVVFVAVDATPLHFTDFARSHVLTTPERLARNLLMHYARATLSRVGWVIGSLDLLGSPAGLLRSAGAGVSDLVRLPCGAISHGPAAFIVGLTSGLVSLMRHLSAGTLTSVTNFASSVSRNMDRLSLDSDHRQRQEMARRRRPLGVGEGLRNGLAGLGLSMLGAVAGLADQPIQSLSVSPSRPAPSPVGAAVGLAGGVGRGLLGAVIKPIGGTAELVSQFGTGLLEGAGLSRQSVRRRMPLDHRTASFADGRLKYLDKLLGTIDDCCIVACLDVDQSEASDGGAAERQDGHRVLLLTTDAVFVVNGDEQEEAFAVALIECRSGREDDTLRIVLQPTDSAPWDKQARVACYISGETPSEVMRSNVARSEVTTTESAGGATSGHYEYRVDGVQRMLFLCHFDMVKRNLTANSFHT